jgi:hypothetical protein
VLLPRWASHDLETVAQCAGGPLVITEKAPEQGIHDCVSTRPEPEYEEESHRETLKATPAQPLQSNCPQCRNQWIRLAVYPQGEQIRHPGRRSFGSAHFGRYETRAPRGSQPRVELGCSLRTLASDWAEVGAISSVSWVEGSGLQRELIVIASSATLAAMPSFLLHPIWPSLADILLDSGMEKNEISCL